jgi:glycine cleavage system pyridoxal-binding protein P
MSIARPLARLLSRSCNVSRTRFGQFSSINLDAEFAAADKFLPRHMGSQGADKQTMLETIGFDSLDSLLKSTVPSNIALKSRLELDAPLSESEALHKLKSIMSKNKVLKSFIGTGYYETQTPGVILRNVGNGFMSFVYTVN